MRSFFNKWPVQICCEKQTFLAFHKGKLTDLLLHAVVFTDPGRIYIKGYNISYPYIAKSRQKRIFPITFWGTILWGYNILVLGVSKFYILYPFLETIANFEVRFLIFIFCKINPERL
jgi:hypothetical protein